MQEKHPLISLFWLTCIVISGMLIGNMVGLMFVLPKLDYNLEQMQLLTDDPTAIPGIKLPMILMQGVTALFAFIIFPFIFYKLVDRSSFTITLKANENSLLLPFFLTLAAIPVNALFVELNAEMYFPSSLSWFENWAKEKEESLKALTEFLTNLNGTIEFSLGLVVFAILPAIGEEYLFRGFVQHYFRKWFQNPHVAIWLTAIIFSAIHLQFYGFFPRMLLGALFGYMYYWSGNLVVPIVAHFTNNAAALVLVYLNNHKVITMDMESASSIPAWLMGTELVVLVALTYYSKKLYNKLYTNE